jgi:hypothetical protein
MGGREEEDERTRLSKNKAVCVKKRIYSQEVSLTETQQAHGAPSVLRFPAAHRLPSHLHSSLFQYDSEPHLLKY